MPIISNKDSFINELKKYIDFNVGISNVEYEFSSNNIKIEERTDDGRGEIYLDISSYSDDTFFVKIIIVQIIPWGMKIVIVMV